MPQLEIIGPCTMLVTANRPTISPIPSTTSPRAKINLKHLPVVAYIQRANPGPDYSSNQNRFPTRRAISYRYELLLFSVQAGL